MRRPQTLASIYDEMRSDYAAAKQSQFRRRRTGVALSGSSADYHYRSEADYLRTMEYARDMDRNDMVVGQGITRAVDNTIQDAIQPDAQTGDDKLDDFLDAAWKDWAENADCCDESGELTWAEIQHTCLRQMHVDGDIVVLPTTDGTLQLIEAHRLRTPSGTMKNVVHGVLLDDRRRRLQYWFCPDDIDPNMPLLKEADIVPVEVRDRKGRRQLFHLYDPKRATQTRGVSSLAPIFDASGMFEDINFAKLVQQQVVSCFALLRERTADFQGDDSQPTLGATRTERRGDGSSKVLTGIGPGMDVAGQIGEKITGFAPDIPNPQFFEHMKMILTIIGINLGLPLVLMLLDASETNFSGFRGAIEQAKLGFRRNQQLLIKRLCVPVYRWKIRQWMAVDPVLRRVAKRPGVDVYGHVWHRPRWPYIEPLKDAEAAAFRRDKGLTSPRRVTAENEGNYWQITDERAADNAYLIRRCKEEAARLNDRFPDDPVGWRDVLDPTGYRDIRSAAATASAESQSDPQRRKEAGFA